MFCFFGISESINSFLTRGHERSINAKKNIFYSFIIKGVSIVVSFLLVPLTINYVNAEKYGIWLTLSSIIAWIGFFDIGFGNGLRNKFAEAKAVGNVTLARIYISTTYIVLSIIIIFVWLIFIFINPLLDWTKVLNTSSAMRSELQNVVYIVFSFFCLRFVFQLITTILLADQKPARASFYGLLGNILSLIIIFILTKFTQGNLYYLALVFGGIPVLVFLIASFYYFNRNYRAYKPGIKFVRFAYIMDLMDLGIKFFLIQIAALIIYQTNNIIIAQLFGPKEVTVYNIAYRYFYIIPMVFSIIITPFWSAFTEANTKNDFTWIKNTMNKLIMIWGAFCILVLIMFIFSDPFYKLWIGKEIQIPLLLSLVMAVTVVINTWCSMFAYYLNGVGKIKLQLYSGMFGAFINIPLAIFLGKIFGIPGVIIAGIILGMISAVWSPIQYYLIINHKAKGIWAK